MHQIKYQLLYRFIFICAMIVFVFIPIAQVDAKKLKAKEYEQNFTVSSGSTLEGKGQGKTVIEGIVTMRNGSKLRNLTVKEGGIVVAKGASVVIESVTVKKSRGQVAILTTGGGTLTVRNSKITGNGKGFYIQRGKNIVLTNNVVTGNREEAIDIRSNVDGVISGNVITGNGESGIEVILGKSTLKITNNTITNNGSSGIAAQFYTLASTIGGLTVSGNNLSSNRNYGIDCKIPSGGNPSKGYWHKSIFLDRSNTVNANRAGQFAPRCGNLFSQMMVVEARERAVEFAKIRTKATPKLEELQVRYNTEFTEFEKNALWFGVERSIWWRQIIGVNAQIGISADEITQNLTQLETDLSNWQSKYQKLLKNDQHRDTRVLVVKTNKLSAEIAQIKSQIQTLDQELKNWQGIVLLIKSSH